MLSSLIHLDLSFVQGDKNGSIRILLHANLQLPPGKFLREDPYDNQSGEAEYEDGGLINELDYKTKKEILSIEEITLAPR